MYELLHGITPFYAESVEEVFSNICKGEIEFLEADEVEDEDELLPEEARNFIQQFLNVCFCVYFIKFIYNDITEIRKKNIFSWNKLPDSLKLKISNPIRFSMKLTGKIFCAKKHNLFPN